MEEVRFINKRFSCRNCNQRFKKLVHYDIVNTKCENCSMEEAYEVVENESNREEADRTYRIAFDHRNTEYERQFHPRTDVLDRDPTNIYGDPQVRQRRVTEERRQEARRPEARIQEERRTASGGRPQGTTQVTTQRHAPRRTQPILITQQIFIPYTISPFNGSVRRQPFNNLFGSLMTDFFQIPNTEFFMDNFASNFSSNFEDPLTRIIFLESMQNQPSGNPPASREAIKKLKKFPMTEEFCKKNEKGDKESPSCSVCIAEIALGQETVLIPCGHMFHDSCINKWLDMHNTCPVCRYELPTEDSDYERMRQQRQNGYTNPNTSNAERNGFTPS